MTRRLLVCLLLAIFSSLIPIASPITVSAQPQHTISVASPTPSLAALSSTRPAGPCYNDAVALGPTGVPPIIQDKAPSYLWQEFPIIPRPIGNPAWRLISAQDGHFIIIYTEDATHYPNDAISDRIGSHFTPAGNADDNNNGTPDYAERVLSCFERAWERLEHYFSPASITTQQLFDILYKDKGYYPVILKNESRGGQTLDGGRNFPVPFTTLHAQTRLVLTSRRSRKKTRRSSRRFPRHGAPCTSRTISRNPRHLCHS